MHDCGIKTEIYDTEAGNWKVWEKLLVKSGIAKLEMASFYYRTPLPTTALLPEVFRQTLKALRSRLRERQRERERKEKKEMKGKGGHS